MVEPASDSPAPRRFRVALSFPGEHRAFVEQVAEQLAAAIGRERVLYDRFYEAEFARVNLDVYLPRLYREQSELIVLFLCPEYAAKRWCRLEWRHIRQLIATLDEDRIMLASFGSPGDLSELGILAGDGYVDIASRPAAEIAGLILQRLGVDTTAVPPKPVKLRADPGEPIEPKWSDELRIYGEGFVGRREELAALDRAWAEGVRIFALHAEGGAGKTRVVVEWLNQMRDAGWRGARRVFVHSFYSRGARGTGCRTDLDEAWEIAERGPMPLFQADIQLYRARLFRDRDALADARRLIEKHGYHRRDEELADAEEAAKGW